MESKLKLVTLNDPSILNCNVTTQIFLFFSLYLLDDFFHLAILTPGAIEVH